MIRHYLAMVAATATLLNAQSYDTAVELAAAPDMVRGYEDVKLGNVRRYLDKVATLQHHLGIDVPLDAALNAMSPVSEGPAGTAA